jgi:dipeptidyl aminopeptidase/acylaminoacyl peptidase
MTGYWQPGQVLAARGYVVLYPNYRGSTGRGVEFSKLGQEAYARPEFDDLVDGARHLARSGLVDQRKVGVTGGSYGGFASAWCATALTEHFAASVMFVGISDHISKFGTTDIPNEMYLVHARRWPWEHWDWYRERSPVYHTEKARTPILILHGEEDSRVHPSQSMELYRYLKTLGKVPVRLVMYPGEGHGNRKAAARYDYSLRLLRWMDHYLKGPGGDPPPHPLELDDERLGLSDD